MSIRTKISGLILNNEGKLLIFRNKDREVWTCPGGKIEEGETELECLERELKEEASIGLAKSRFLLETPVELAAGSIDNYVIMKMYIVEEYTDEPRINPEDTVEEMKWISVQDFNNRDFEIGSGLVKYAIPELIELGLMR